MATKQQGALPGAPGTSAPGDTATDGAVGDPPALKTHKHGREHMVPLLIPGLQLWLRADRLALSDGAAVGTWADESGNANTVTQATAGNKPTFKTNIVNGKPVVRFSAASAQNLVTAASFPGKPAFAIAVVNASSLAANRAIAGCVGGATSFYWRMNSTGKVEFDSALSVAILVGTATLSAGTWYILSISYDGTGNAAAYQNGTADGTATSNQTFTSRVRMIGNDTGANEPFQGDIAEYIEYNVALAAPARRALETYLGAKYAITMSLP